MANLSGLPTIPLPVTYGNPTSTPKSTTVRSAAPLPLGPVKDPGVYAQTMVPESDAAFQARIASQTSAPQNVGLVSAQPAAPVRPSQAQVDPLMAALASLDTILANKNQQTHDEYGRAIAGYDAQDALDLQAHDQNVHQNEQNYTANNQAALLNAANAGSGLRGVMASLGSLAGSGSDVIKRLVGLAANTDTGASRQTFDTNAGGINTAWSQATQQQKQRRNDANATLDNNLQNNKAGVLTSRQGIYQQLANLYGDQLPEGNDYASKASALAPEIAATTKASVAPYAAPASSFSPEALKTYLAGTQNLNASAAGSSQAAINSPVFLAQQKKDQLAGVA